LKPYDVKFRMGKATGARKVGGGFEVTLDQAEVVACRGPRERSRAMASTTKVHTGCGVSL
jgi:hypothetical protein